jgi:hypothetical protein
MAKKSNRSRSKPAVKKPAVVQPEPVEPEIEEPLGTKPPKSANQATKPKRAMGTGERMEEEYAYIVGDLRRVLILAAIMFILLISANLILSRVSF